MKICKSRISFKKIKFVGTVNRILLKIIYKNYKNILVFGNMVLNKVLRNFTNHNLNTFVFKSNDGVEHPWRITLHIKYKEHIII
jgi:hypothetical protein